MFQMNLFHSGIGGIVINDKFQKYKTMSFAETLRNCRNSAAFLCYLPIRYFLPLSFRLFGAEQSIVGNCIIIAPAKQMKIILEGVEYMRHIDPGMFQNLTVHHRFLFWYHKSHFIQCRDVFTITDNYLLWGKEGVVIAFVQSILEYTIGYLSWEKSIFENHQAKSMRRHKIQQRLFEWMIQQQFSSELIEMYRKFAQT
jgi:hypothetical protein